MKEKKKSIFNKLFGGKKKLFWLVLVLAIGGGVYFKIKNSSSNKAEIKTAKVVRKNLISSLTLSGQIKQSNTISVFTKTSGVVNKVYVTDGQEVKKGDKLADITPDSEGINNQASAWASYLNAKKGSESDLASKYSNQAAMFGKWDTFKELAESDLYKDTNSVNRTLPEFAIPQDEWLAAEANYKISDTSISSSQASLSYAWNNYQLYQSTVTASVDGEIIGFNLAEGLSLLGSQNSNGGAVNQTVASIRTVGNPVAAFTATEIDINQIKVGQKVDLSLDSITDKKYKGTIAAVDRVGTVTSGVTQYTVLVTFDETDERILTNMALTADIVMDSRDNVLVVSNDAVNSRGGEKMVRIMKDGRITPVQVETGLVTDTETEVINGLSEGDLVVTTSLSSTSSNSGNNGNTENGRPGGNVLIPGIGGGGVRGGSGFRGD